MVVALELRLRCRSGGFRDTKTIGNQVGLRQALTWRSVYRPPKKMIKNFVRIVFLTWFCFVAEEEDNHENEADLLVVAALVACGTYE